MRICPQCRLQYPDDVTSCRFDGVLLQPLADPLVGTTLAGRYVIERLLGEGGMARVYQARHTVVDRAVAIKVMLPEIARDAALRERFRREARNAASLAHPRIVDIYDFGETPDGAPYLVMELLHGSALDDLLEARRLSIPDVLRIGAQIAEGLARAHDLGVVHRDLKPGNIFVDVDAEGGPSVKLVDFGIARSVRDPSMTRPGELLGTPQYLAPEVISSNSPNPSVDLYALGCVLHEMVTGQRPFQANDVLGFIHAHLHERPQPARAVNPACPPELEALILALLAKSPAERPVDAHAVARTLRAMLHDGAHTLTLHAPISSASEQRLAALDVELRAGRERFGHAAHELGTELSRTREDLKNAIASVSVTEAAEFQAGQACETAERAITERRQQRTDQPSIELASAYRHAAALMESWASAQSAHHEAESRRDRAQAREQELEQQVGALREQLAKFEQAMATRREAMLIEPAPRSSRPFEGDPRATAPTQASK